MANVSRDYLGWAALKKISGSGAIAAGTQINIPVALVSPADPENFSYLPVINRSAYPTISTIGKQTPIISVSTYVKASWFTANLLNSLIITADSNGDTDLWAVAVSDETNSPRIYDDARVASVRFSQAAQGGPIAMTIDFVCRYGEGEKPTPTTISTPTGTVDYGPLIDVAHVDFSSTADAVYSWDLTLMRSQTPIFELDQTMYAAQVVSGPLSGTLTINQSPKTTTVPTTAWTVRIYTAGDPPSGSKVTIATKVKLVNASRQHDPGLGVVTRDYILISGDGTIPVVIS